MRELRQRTESPPLKPGAPALPPAPWLRPRSQAWCHLLLPPELGPQVAGQGGYTVSEQENSVLRTFSLNSTRDPVSRPHPGHSISDPTIWVSTSPKDGAGWGRDGRGSGVTSKACHV